MRKRYRVAFVLVCLLPLYLHWHRLPAADPRCLPDSAVDPRQTYSNILPEDYVGPETCAGCHPKKFDLWSHHPHSRMNQLPTDQSVLGDFSDAVLNLPHGAVTFSRGPDGYQMAVSRAGQPLRRYRVTRTVGTLVMQFYIGVQLEGPETRDHAIYDEHMLPFAYWVGLKRWLPKHYFDPDGPEDLEDGVPRVEGLDKISDVRPYGQVCLNCHNTYPYAYRVAHEMFAGFPDATVAAAFGPLSRKLADTVSVGPSLESFAWLNNRLDPDRHLVTLGISCESCHFGGREHALRGEKIRFVPASPFLRVSPKDPGRPVSDSRKNPATVNGICVQCHSGNARLFPNGASQCNSREGLDFRRGACASQMRCVDCHEPHTAGPPAGAPVNPDHLALCVTCHERLGDPAAAAAHARHPAGAGVSCLDCHMPRYTQGLGGLVRTHRICLPVEKPMAAAASANACNLCHLDKSLDWTLRELEKGWNQDAVGGDRRGAPPDRATPLGLVWLRGADPGLRLLAAQSYAGSPLGKTVLPDLLRALDDPEPINRVFAEMAVGRVRGRKLGPGEYDVTAPPAERVRKIERLLAEMKDEAR